MSKSTKQEKAIEERQKVFDQDNFFKKHDAPRVCLNIGHCLIMDISRDFKKLFVGGPDGTYIIRLGNDPEIESFYDSE